MHSPFLCRKHTLVTGRRRISTVAKNGGASKTAKTVILEERKAFCGDFSAKDWVNSMKRLFRNGLLFLIVCLCALSSFAASAQEVYEGLDVSVWQEEIDFQQVKDSGKQVVYIRAGEGREEDRRFRAHTQGAMDSGMKVGFYFFVTATDAAQAREQADFFASLIDTLQISLMIVDRIHQACIVLI